MSKDYAIFSVDEGTIIVSDRYAAYGHAIADGNITHEVYGTTLEEYLLEKSREPNAKEIRRLAEEGKIFQRTVPGKGTFVFFPNDTRIPLPTYISGAEDTLASSGSPAENKAIAAKYGLTSNPFDGSAEIIEGLKEVQKLLRTKGSDLPITEFNPDDDKRKGGGHAR